jgi:zinc protease
MPLVRSVVMGLSNIRSLFAIALSGVAIAARPPVRLVTAVGGVEEYRLENGLRILLAPFDSPAPIAISVTYLSGARHERPGLAGTAHFVEHMMSGTTLSGRDVRKEQAAIGAISNASTSWDRTNFISTVASSDALRLLLELEAERMSRIGFDNAAMERERRVILNELDMRANNSDLSLLEAGLGTAFAAHGYGRSAAGTRSSIAGLSAGGVRDFYVSHYRPDNAVVAIAGAFRPAQTLEWARRSFGRIRLNPPFARMDQPEELPQEAEKSVRLRLPGAERRFVLIYHVPGALHEDVSALDVLATVLGGESGMFRRRGATSSSTTMLVQRLRDPGFLLCEGRAADGSSPEAASSEIIRIAEGLASDPPSSTDVAAAAAEIIEEFYADMRSPRALASALSEYAAGGDWRLLFLEPVRIGRVGPKDVARVAARYLRPTNRTVAFAVPEPSPGIVSIPLAVNSEEMFRALPRHGRLGNDPSVAVGPDELDSRIRRRVGRRATVVTLPATAGSYRAAARLTVVLPGDSLANPSAARATGELLLARPDFHSALRGLGFEASTVIEPARWVVTLSGPADRLEAALGLIGSRLRTPSFRPPELQQIQKRERAALEAARRDPAEVARRALFARLRIGPLLRSIDGQITDLSAVSTEDLQHLAQAVHAEAGVLVVVLGNADVSHLQSAADGIFGPEPKHQTTPAVPPMPASRDHLPSVLDVPGTRNGVVIGGVTVDVSSGDPDYAALLLAEFFIGGSPDSILFQALRGREGLSYASGAEFTPRKGIEAGRFVLAGTGPSADLARIESAMKSAVNQVITDGFSAATFTRQQKAYLERRKMAFADPAILLRIVSETEAAGAGKSSYTALERDLASLTAADVSAVVRRWLKPERFVYVRAGDVSASAEGGTTVVGRNLDTLHNSRRSTHAK